MRIAKRNVPLGRTSAFNLFQIKFSFLYSEYEVWQYDTFTPLFSPFYCPYTTLHYSIYLSRTATWAIPIRIYHRRRRPSLVIRLPSGCVRSSHDCETTVINVNTSLKLQHKLSRRLPDSFQFVCLSVCLSACLPVCLAGCLHHNPLCDVCGHAFSAKLDVSSYSPPSWSSWCFS